MKPSVSKTNVSLNLQNNKLQKLKRGLSEKQTGYLLILPALLVILAIAIWPVIQSFYLSMFDMQLSNPTKREAFFSYNINLDDYADNYQSLLKTFDYEIGKADDSVKTELQKDKQTIIDIHTKLMENSSLSKNYNKIRDYQMNLQPVPASLTYFKLPNNIATDVLNQYQHIDAQLTNMQANNLLNRPKDIVGALHMVQQTIIKPNFIGLGNYKAFLQDNRMWNSLKNTVVFTVVSVATELVFGLLIALLINKNFKGRGLVRAAVLVPWAIPTVIAAKMWLFMYNGEYGIVAKFFSWIHLIPNMGVLLVSKNWQMFSVIFADVWKTTPFMALLLLAGLQTIPTSLYEAAMVDGATKIQQFFRITLPLMKSTILVALLFRTLDAFRVFDLIYVLLGHSQSTEVISTYAYQRMFAETEFGAGSALSVIVFICVGIISIGFIKLLGTDLLEDKR